ncbi:MAG: MerR family transcriptional regulator [Thermomicrobiales bacterium]
MTHDPGLTTHDRYSLTELTEAAGVSVRTVRYYIAEGLLPPPVSAGPHSHYTRGHLDRLLLIGRLKASYLPLREIRRELAGLDDVEVHRLVADSVEAAGVLMEAETIDHDAAASPPRPAAPPRDSAADYVSRVMAQASGRQTGEADDPWRQLQPAIGRVAFSPLSPAEPSPITHHPVSGTWRRVPLSDDAELLIREEAYTRKRDRVDWLVRWARKVFG